MHVPKLSFRQGMTNDLRFSLSRVDNMNLIIHLVRCLQSIQHIKSMQILPLASTDQDSKRGELQSCCCHALHHLDCCTSAGAPK